MNHRYSSSQSGATLDSASPELPQRAAGSKDGGRLSDAVKKLLQRTENSDGKNVHHWKIVEAYMKAVLSEGAVILHEMCLEDSDQRRGDVSGRDTARKRGKKAVLQRRCVKLSNVKKLMG